MRRLLVAGMLIGLGATAHAEESGWPTETGDRLARLCTSSDPIAGLQCTGILQGAYSAWKDVAFAHAGGYYTGPGGVTAGMLEASFLKHIDDSPDPGDTPSRLKPAVIVLLRAWTQDGYLTWNRLPTKTR